METLHGNSDERRLVFVLVHGAWHHGGHWAATAEELRRRGHKVHAPTVTGHGPGAARNVTHTDGVASIVDYLDEHQLNEIVLVGHSFGGTIISKVAEQIPDRIRRLVYFNAFVLPDGGSVFDEIPRDMARMMRRSLVDGTVMLPFEMWRERFVNDADLAVATRTFRTLSPEPVAMLEDHLDLRQFYKLLDAGRLRSSYLYATDDNSLPPGEASGWHPRFSSRLGLCRLVQMPGSHEALLTRPGLLARKLVEAGRD
ncbi:alpha/beta fold hydrolase [Actinomadura rudentiformis]|uniref:Alpha/beta hydrolase n=1 Tax=Actinomadura rudentiformis TaxID=359158 RepID=A0A6H9YSL7_9ACTN|nr:alpha/beta fold hydrolase [Actinomadura rudentiformis]KAB2344889.1 alpha/beta hydrolase [Actinomadura rudentiformis]